MSLLLRAQGRNEEALSLLQRAVSSDPEYSRAVELLYFLTANNN
jgi:Flp pilus assembly protein TadD